MKFKKGNIPDSRFNKRQLKIGIRIEKEHTNSAKIAKMIAKAHLSEFPNYYTYLVPMEKKMSKALRK